MEIARNWRLKNQRYKMTGNVDIEGVYHFPPKADLAGDGSSLLRRSVGHANTQLMSTSAREQKRLLFEERYKAYGLGISSTGKGGMYWIEGGQLKIDTSYIGSDQAGIPFIIPALVTIKR